MFFSAVETVGNNNDMTYFYGDGVLHSEFYNGERPHMDVAITSAYEGIRNGDWTTKGFWQ